MPKSLFCLFAALALLLAALAFGRVHAPRASEARGFVTARSSMHGRAAVRAPSHARTTIDDDDDCDDDESIDTAMLAPDGHDRHVGPDATPGERTGARSAHAFTTRIAALRLTGPGIRPSGEHRSTADRPPRS